MARRTRPADRKPLLDRTILRLNRFLRDKHDDLLSRRPHRSFRRTYRRDYVRTLALPGYIPFSFDVLGVLLRHIRTIGLFFILYSIASLLILGLVSQTNYSAVSKALTSTSDPLLRFGSLFGAAVSAGFTLASDISQQILAGLLVLIAWLTMVWLLRNYLNGKKVTLRGALYNAGSPIVPTFLVTLVALLQALPAFAVVIAYSAFQPAGILDGGVETMLFVTAAAVLVLLSLYWLSGTFIALVIVTIPGMYPLAAIKAAGDLVIGRRLRVLLRLLWLGLTLALMWAVVLIPVILLDSWINQAWLPLVPVTVLLLTTATLIWSSSYIYILYRRLVDDPTPPA